MNKNECNTLAYEVFPVIHMLTMTTSSFFKKFIFIVSCVQPICVLAQIDCDWIQFKHENGVVASEGCFVDGVPVGIWKSYDNTGMLMSEGERQNDKPQGLWKFYNEGVLRETAEFRDGKKNGIQTLWKSGVLMDSVSWYQGQRQGNTISFRSNGSKVMVVSFDQDKREGKATLFNENNEPNGYRWYKNDRLLASESFNRFDDEGRKSGSWKVFHSTGRVMETGFYEEGLEHGTFQYFDARGTVTAVVEYDHGQKVLQDQTKKDVIEIQTTRREDGSVSETVTYVNGIKEGVTRRYDKTGNIIGGSVFSMDVLVAEGITDEEGNRNGPWKEYWPTGGLRFEGSYIDGSRDGKWVFYRESGEKEQQGDYKQDVLQGSWTWWYPGGSIHRQEQYIQGDPVGHFIELDTTGKPLVSGYFEDGLQHGEWMIQVNDHLEKGNYVFGEKDGLWVHMYDDGHRQFEGDYILGQPEGRHRTWYQNGVLKEEGKFEGGAKHRKWRLYDDKGVLMHEYLYRYGKLRKVDGSKVDKRRDGKLKGN